MANIKKARRNTTPIEHPPRLLDVVHMNIGHGDCVSVGGARYCVLLVDRTSRNARLNGLKSLNHEELIHVMQQFHVDAGPLPDRLYTDFEKRDKTEQFLLEIACKVRAAPGGRQNQNGLVERAWQSIVNMAW